MAYKRGIDVSHWEPVVDWVKVRDAGYEFAFVKASQGTAVDSLFSTHWNNARGIIRRGAYAFYDPRWQAITPKVQAEKFWSLLENDPGEITPVVDIEMYTSGPWHGADFWYDFISHFQRISGMYPMIYTAYYYWMDNIKINPVADSRWFAQHCKLWVANYDVTQPMIPLWWSDWSYWQYSETGIVDGVFDELGRPTECDLNYAKDGVIDPVPPEEPDTMYGKVLVNLNIRSEPRVAVNNKIGSLLAGDLIEATMKVNGWWSITKIMRAGVGVALPATPCYAYEGDTQGYIQTLPPPSNEDYIVHFIDGEQHFYDRRA